MIVRCLSMDKSIIDECSYLSKYFNKIPSNLFYKLCCDIIPQTNAFFPYIKNKTTAYNETLIDFVMKRYETSKTEAIDYCKILFNVDGGIDVLKNICTSYGLTEKETKKIMEN